MRGKLSAVRDEAEIQSAATSSNTAAGGLFLNCCSGMQIPIVAIPPLIQNCVSNYFFVSSVMTLYNAKRPAWGGGGWGEPSRQSSSSLVAGDLCVLECDSQLNGTDALKSTCTLMYNNFQYHGWLRRSNGTNMCPTQGTSLHMLLWGFHTSWGWHFYLCAEWK